MEEVDNTIDCVWFEKIEGYSCIGDYKSGAIYHPIQYTAKTNCPEGWDDGFEGIGWSPLMAIKSLLKVIKYAKDNPYDPEEDL